MIYARTRDYHTEPAPGVLPEPLHAEGVKLLIADAAIFLALLILSVPAGLTRDVCVCGFTVLGVAALFGRYRESIAPSPRDEWYTTVSIGLVSALAMLFVVPLFAVSWIAATVALIVWAAVGSFAAATLTAHRRGEETPAATTAGLTAVDRKRARNGLVRSTIATLDFLIAGCATVILSPVLAICALAIAAERGGPVLFLQRRVGVDGRDFTMFKFRTMRVGAGNEWASEKDDRITGTGRFLRRTSLDELPQLWNVLRGEMSLVGPRPEMIEYADRFVRTVPNYEDRQAIPPGITGWAQIQYDRNFQPDEFQNVLQYDLFYVAHYSLPLYVFCLVKTAAEVFHHRAV